MPYPKNNFITDFPCVSSQGCNKVHRKKINHCPLKNCINPGLSEVLNLDQALALKSTPGKLC